MLATSSRLLRLLGLMQTGQEWTGPALAERLDVEPRTVRRDIERLRQLGYPVATRRGVLGGYRLGSNATLPPLLLDAEEALAVAVGLRSAAVASVEGADEAAARALAKLEKVLPPILRSRMSALSAGLIALPTGAAPISGQSMTAILRACEAQVRLRFQYRGSDGTTSHRDTEPHRLVQAGRRWYLVAWDCDRDDWRTFRVDRMAELSVSTFVFAARQPDLDAASLVSRAVSSAAYRYQAKVFISVPAERVAELVPSTVGMVVPQGPGECLLLTGSDSLTSIALHLASLNFPMRIQEPPELIESMHELGRRLLGAEGSSAE